METTIPKRLLWRCREAPKPVFIGQYNPPSPTCWTGHLALCSDPSWFCSFDFLRISSRNSINDCWPLQVNAPIQAAKYDIGRIPPASGYFHCDSTGIWIFFQEWVCCPFFGWPFFSFDSSCEWKKFFASQLVCKRSTSCSTNITSPFWLFNRKDSHADLTLKHIVIDT